MNNNTKILMSVVGLLWMTESCNHPASAAASPVRHQVEIEKNGSVLYVDQVESNRILKQEEETNTKGSFASFKIGLNNSFPFNSKREKEWGVHFEYNMTRDWVALIEGDSLSPVFFHPVIGLNTKTREAILVFELPAGARQPDTLIYNDSFGTWQQQIIPLNQNQNKFPE